MSGEVVLMTLVGGLGTIFGPFVGAFIIIAMQNYFAEFGQWVTIIQGVIFVICVLLFRRGIVGEIAALLRIKLDRVMAQPVPADPQPRQPHRGLADVPVSADDGCANEWHLTHLACWPIAAPRWWWSRRPMWSGTAASPMAALGSIPTPARPPSSA
jgi:hypothetical protein